MGLTKETLLHDELKLKIAAVLSLLVDDPGRLGRVFADRMRLVNVANRLAAEPDGMLVSHAALQSGRVRLIDDAQSGSHRLAR